MITQSCRALLAIFSTVYLLHSAGTQAVELTPQAAESIAREAYIVAYPSLQNYRTLYNRVVLSKRAFNKIYHRSKLMGPEFTAIVGPNNDTLYSAAWIDLRGGPIEVNVPEIPADRYYSLQFVDMYVYNFAYIGQRSTGSKAGRYLLTGPHHAQVDESGYDGVFHSESDFVFIIGRMLAQNPQDAIKASALQQQITVASHPSSQQKMVPPIELPVWDEAAAQTPEFIKLYNFLLPFMAIHPSEKAMYKKFEAIGIGANDFESLSPALKSAVARGVEVAYAEIAQQAKSIGSDIDGWNTTFHGFGSRQVMDGKYLLRAAAAKMALYGNDREENSSYTRRTDAQGEVLDGSKASYKIHIAADAFPPADAFWSLTMYRLPEVLLYANDIARYSIGDRTPDLKFNEDGSLTLFLQHTAPEKNDEKANWLPAPAGPFVLALRMYLPKVEVINGEWAPPTLSVTEYIEGSAKVAAKSRSGGR